MIGALDIEMRITSFPDVTGSRRGTTWISLREFAATIAQRQAPDKVSLPLMKLAAFGERRSAKGSFRHDKNVLEVSGAELDYDGEELSLDQAAAILRTAKVPAIVYSSPSHTPDKPRFRIVVPFSIPRAPEWRARMVSRIAGLFPVQLAPESWVLSQAYFYGSIHGQPPVTIIEVDGDDFVCVDLRDDLDTTATSKPGKGNGTHGQAGEWFDTGPGSGTADEDDLRVRIATGGEGTHDALVSLAGLLARSSASENELISQLTDALQKRPAAARNADWHQHLAGIPRLVAWVLKKEQARRADDPWAQQQAAPEPPDLSVIHLNRRSPPPFPLEVFGERWAAWIRTTAAAACCPVDYVAAPLLATASSLIGNARWAEGQPGWTEPPVLWLAAIGDSGSGKSPGGDAIFSKIVPTLEKRMVGDFPEKHRDWLTVAEVAKAKEAQWSAAVAAAMKKGEPPPLRPADIDPGSEPQMPRLRQSDVTVEKVAQLLGQSAPKGLLLVRDELAGFLTGMTAYNEGARAFWLEAYGGRPYTVERIRLAEPLRVPHMTCAWYGTIQPERLATLLTDADDGLLARFTYFWPERIRFQLTGTAPDVSFALDALDYLRALEMYRSDGQLYPIIVPLVTHARPRLMAFAHAMDAEQDMAVGLLRSAYGKARGLALRLSLILEFLRWAASDPDPFNPDPPSVISEQAFADACRLVAEYIMPMAARTYGDSAADLAERGAAMLARWMVQASPHPSEIHIRTMQRTVRLPGLKDAKDIHAACKVLVEAGWLLPSPHIGGVNRARAAYPINPALWEAWDAHQ